MDPKDINSFMHAPAGSLMPDNGGRRKKIITIIVLLVAVAGAGYYYLNSKKNSVNEVDQKKIDILNSLSGTGSEKGVVNTLGPTLPAKKGTKTPPPTTVTDTTRINVLNSLK